MGVSQQTVSNHDEPRQAHPARSTNFSTSDDDIVDAEIVEDDEPTTPNATTDPMPVESVITVTCPTCHGTGKVTR